MHYFTNKHHSSILLHILFNNIYILFSFLYHPQQHFINFAHAVKEKGIAIGWVCMYVWGCFSISSCQIAFKFEHKAKYANKPGNKNKYPNPDQDPDFMMLWPLFVFSAVIIEGKLLVIYMSQGRRFSISYWLVFSQIFTNI